MNEDYNHATQVAGTLSLVGMIIGIGSLLASSEKLTLRIVFGRAISSAGLGAASSAILILIPDLPLAALLGCAALIASLGTSALERAFQKWLGK